MDDPVEEFAKCKKFGYCLTGTVAFLLTYPVTYPLELIKTRLQNEQISRTMQYHRILYANQCKSIPDCLWKTYRLEGIFGLYRGTFVTFCFIGVEKAMKFGSYEYFMPQFEDKEFKKGTYRYNRLQNHALAGGLAGLCQTVFTTPMEFFRIQMQDAGRTALTLNNLYVHKMGLTSLHNHTEKMFSRFSHFSRSNTYGANVAINMTMTHRLNATEVAEYEFRKFGIPGLYRGCAATAIRDVLFSAIYFPLYAHLVKYSRIHNKWQNHSVFWLTFIPGFLSSAIAVFLVTPMDVVKTRLQLLKRRDNEESYIGIRNCFKQIYLKEGPRTFFKGSLCRVLSIAPFFGTIQVIFSQKTTHRLLGCERNEEKDI